MNERWKVWSAVIAAAAAILFAVVWYYNLIQRPLWDEQQAARKLALEQTPITEITSIETFSGAESYQIVFGTDEAGTEWIVWAGKEELHAEKADDGWARNQIRLMMQENEPEAELIRIVPGVWKDEYVWEVYYLKRESRGKRHYYDYYRFSDGEKLTTLRLSLIPD
ncbi:hypothetical protein DUZ99_11035 [Xylanibacillus composti]|uniref:Cell wall elongation regulator TseB-like domain-containing protein n=1 Tax=Xylanibacillus composti TaxID=1572762 RepID=A0A8J4H2M9_9BACL|nr:DUF5590 domain-containing protein [Xylanibacillus composti]MDT9725504.1 hypothetical protein [Xylanibacillus composti]GIQ67598.1 hypothetical protein XYCOK13_04220 [Xylanibacillus composti]